MNKAIIQCTDVRKDFPIYHHFTGGIKSFLFHFPTAIKEMRKSRFTAIKNISFEVSSGETVGIIGKNGAGKSTILGLLAGVLKPSSGQVTVAGRIAPLLELGAGFHPELSGRENILLNGILLGMLKREVEEKIDSIIEFSELEKFIDQPIRTYSSGMLARLGFSVAVHCEPDILLLDEVLSVGDQGFQKKCIEKMMGFKRNGKTIVFVSHNSDEILKVCDRVIWIDKGIVYREGRVDQVINEYIEH
ncbi:MAG: ABC transporter ATP-binding protein [Candidatus Marinimicrobia bacterium]|nr:ABC transporter ATP-binding protein [Candidatus Neomarinimicrobiota bacterium]